MNELGDVRKKVGVEIVEDYPTLRVVKPDFFCDFEIELTKDEIENYNKVMGEYSKLYNFLKEKIKESGEDPEDYDLF